MSESDKLLKMIYDNLYHDGYCFWLPDWPIGKDGEVEAGEKPSFDEFIKSIKECHHNATYY